MIRSFANSHSFACRAASFGAAVLAAALLASCGSPAGKAAGPSRYVDPMIGTGGHGHVFPGPTVPSGMVQLSPDTKTRDWDWCSGYNYSSKTIMGFSHTHLSGTGCGDYGDILFMPTVGAVRTEAGPEDKPEEGYRSPFSHANEHAEPGYYRVKLDKGGITAELTATARCGLHKYIFPASDKANVIIDLEHGISNRCLDGRIEIKGDRRVEGVRRATGWAADRSIYFAAEFSKPFESFGTAAGTTVAKGARTAEGNAVKAFLTFSTRRGEAVMARVGISAVSLEGARKNLETEMPDFDFDKYRRSAREAWDHELGRIRVQGGSEADTRTFYTALYHFMSVPNVFQDVDGLYYGLDHKIHKAEGFTNYTVFSLWDTFRAAHPLYTIIRPDLAQAFVQTLVQGYKEGGLLPVWPLWGNETNCMIGYHSVPVIFDAWMKGLRGFDAGAAFEAMKHSAEADNRDLDYYRKLGFIPSDRGEEPVSKTIELSYDDWCIAQMAKGLGRTADYDKFNQRSLFYRNVFDPGTGFMRGRTADGRFYEPFDPFAISGQYTEANAWQYSLAVLQDPAGLLKLYGGQKGLAAKLDALFSAPSKTTGRVQPDVTGLIGQDVHGNEPSHHLAYLYDHAGEPWKAQNMVREIMTRMYSDKVDGLCGNEDCGQMSAWYALSALGFYPVTPGQNAYAIGSPIFEKAEIDVGGGRKFTIEAHGTSNKARYIRSAALDGQKFDRVWLTHGELMKGGVLSFEMSEQPNESWGRDASGLLAMAPDDSVVSAPLIESSGEVFHDRTTIKLSSPTPGIEIRYTLDGSEPGPASPLYAGELSIDKAGMLKAAAFRGQKRSLTVSARFYKSKCPAAVYTHPFSAHYNGGGPMALTDGREGSNDSTCGLWQGFEGDDLEAVIDLGSVRPIRQVSAGFLQNTDRYIFFPASVVFSVSNDGRTFVKAAEIINAIDPRTEPTTVRRFVSDTTGFSGRFLKVTARNIGVCPPWHSGAGGKAWIFVDEVKAD